MKVYVAMTAYDDGINRTPHFLRTHGIFSDEQDAIGKIFDMYKEDLKAWKAALDNDGKSRAMEREDSGVDNREIFIRNGRESITYRVVSQDIHIGFGE